MNYNQKNANIGKGEFYNSGYSTIKRRSSETSSEDFYKVRKCLRFSESFCKKFIIIMFVIHSRRHIYITNSLFDSDAGAFEVEVPASIYVRLILCIS